MPTVIEKSTSPAMKKTPAVARIRTSPLLNTITGSSEVLAVNTVAGARFGVNIIPHTREQTIIAAYGPDTKVNLEADLIARYLEGLLRSRG